MENYNTIQLNEEQKNAMLATEGAVLVTAGAGSGKTRLLTQRIYYLINNLGVPQENILAITFTNKASKEMQERVETLLNGKCNVWISTIHSMCATILRKSINRLNIGVNNHFTIFGADDSFKLLKNIVNSKKSQEEDDDAPEKDDSLLKKVAYHISNMKNKDLSIDEYAEKLDKCDEAETILKTMESYQKELVVNNALDFDDLLVFTRKLLSEDELTRDFYQKRFKYILVDEFQDTNVVQYNIVKLLAGFYKNVFVVGDEDQCIYGWRGANIENIKNFIKDYENCKVFKLEKNYRSTKNILNLANSLIEKNSERIPKKLYTENSDGKPVIFRTFADDKEEADYVVRNIYQLQNSGVQLKDVAILMRLNALSRNIEEKLMLYNISYMVFGGFKFYDRLEIKIMLSYLRFINNVNDSISFEKIINFPRRGIGEATISKIFNIASRENLSLMFVIKNIESYSEFTQSTKLKIKEFASLIENLIEYSTEHSVSETLDYIYRKSGIKELYKEKNEENTNRSMNIQNLIGSAQEFEDGVDEPDIEKFLQSVALVSDVDTSDGTANSVTLATVHAVKGLEFKYVFIVGLEQKVFPIVRDDSLDEEERRLMYVAITRAKESLCLTNAKSRYMYGKEEKMFPSKFLQELGFITQNNMDAANYKIKVKNYGVRYSDEDEDSLIDRSLDFANYSNKKSFAELNKNKNGFTSTKKQEKKGFEIGKRVNHAIYGEGTITSITGAGPSKIINIQFDNVGTKSLVLDFAPITLL